MTTHIINADREHLCAIGYARNVNLLWTTTYIASDGEVVVSSFSPSRAGIKRAFATIRDVGSCSSAVESSVTHMLLGDMSNDDPEVKVEIVDWTKDIPISSKGEDARKLMEYLLTGKLDMATMNH